MPCNCDHMEPSYHESESIRLLGFLKEVGLYASRIPLYGEVKKLHEHTALLCKFCQDNDVTKYSLELQIWWRDHQKADKIRIEKEHRKAKTEEEKRIALAKLTDYERKLLGI